MNYLVIALSYGDGDEPGVRVHAVRFFTRQAAAEVADWLNSLTNIEEAKLIVDAFEDL